MRYDFAWDPNKAKGNRIKHGVNFEQAATVFQDPRAATIYDDEHSDYEDRWITLGVSSSGGLITVFHTFNEIDNEHAQIRIFSCRKATDEQKQQYTED
ncbi:BrnT family toxin [PVC group bacterium]|nr:BrnT family toxin [PVC group bacterium]